MTINMMTGKEKLYFLLNAIEDARAIASSGQDVIFIDPSHDLNNKLSGDELTQLFAKLEQDEKVLEVVKKANRIKRYLYSNSSYGEDDDGKYHIKLLPGFADYYVRKQREPEYQEFSGRKPLPEPKVIDKAVLARAEGKTFGEFTNDLKRLQDQYNAIKDYPEREFFLGLSDYVKMIVETPGIDAVADLINQQLKEDEKEVARLEALVREDVGKVEKELFGMISSKGVDFPLLKEAVDDYVGVRDGRIQSSAQLEEALWGEMANVVRVLKENGYGELVKKFVITESEGENIVGFSISPVYADYQEELRKFRELKGKTVWGSWNDLTLVYLVVHKFDEELKRLDPQKDVWRRMNFIGLWGEMQKIIKGQPGARIEFVRDAYKLHLDRVHRFSMEKLFPMYPVIQSVMERVAEYKFDTSFLQAPALYLGSVQSAIGTIQSFAGSVQSVIESMQGVAGAVSNLAQIAGNVAGTVNRFNSFPSISLPVSGLSGFSEPRWRGEVLTRLEGIEERISQGAEYNSPVSSIAVQSISLNQHEDIVVGKLRYSFGSCELNYDGGKGVDAPLDNQEMKFFLSLHGRIGDVVDYKDLCRDANTRWYRELAKNGVVHEELKNSDFASDAYILRRDFRSLVVSAGMPEEEFGRLIKTVSKKGYKLVGA